MERDQAPRAKPVPSVEVFARSWATDDPARVMGRGHPVGDFLEAHDALCATAQATLIELRE